MTRFLQNIKKRSDISFHRCHRHEATAGVSTALLAFPTWQPSPAVTFPSGRCAPTPPCCCCMPIPRRSRAPVTRAARPAEPSQVLLSMVVVVVLVWHRFRPRRLQLPSSGSPMLQAHVSSVSYGCCKIRSGCYICCNDCRRMLQVSFLNVSSVFSDVCCKCVYLDIAYVSHIYCKFFIWMLHIFAIILQVFSMCFCDCFRCIFRMF
jgi:hypothetical protein